MPFFRKRERSRTMNICDIPSMKLGLTDHVWSMDEMMSFLYRQNINYKVSHYPIAFNAQIIIHFNATVYEVSYGRIYESQF